MLCLRAAVTCWSPCDSSTSTPVIKWPTAPSRLAFALVVRAPDRTLTAKEALEVRDSALAEAASRMAAALR